MSEEYSLRIKIIQKLNKYEEINNDKNIELFLAIKGKLKELLKSKRINNNNNNGR